MTTSEEFPHDPDGPAITEGHSKRWRLLVVVAMPIILIVGLFAFTPLGTVARHHDRLGL